MRRGRKEDFFPIAMPDYNPPAVYLEYLLGSIISMPPYVEIAVKIYETKKVGYILRIDTHPSLQAADGFYDFYLKQFKSVISKSQPTNLTLRIQKAKQSYPNDKNYKRSQRLQITVASQIVGELISYQQSLQNCLQQIENFRKKDYYPLTHELHQKTYGIKFIQDSYLAKKFGKPFANSFKTIPLPDDVLENNKDGILFSHCNDFDKRRLENYCAKFTSKKKNFLIDLEEALLRKKEINRKHLSTYKRLISSET